MNESSVSTRHINLSYLLLMADGDLPMQKLMLSMLLDEMPAQLEKMNLAFEQTDWHTLRRLSHKMKTTLSFVGNHELILADHELVEELKTTQNEALIAECLHRLNELMPIALEELKMVNESIEL
ncbi:MAG: Hpt domain-containing protein [Bacteroidota bacterium]